MSDQEAASANRYTHILEHAESNPKPNWTQYQLAIAEHDARLNGSVQTSAAYRKLRNLMETKFIIVSIDSLIDE